MRNDEVARTRVRTVLVAWLSLVAAPCGAAEVGTIHVDVRVTSPRLPLIQPAPVLEEMAKALADELTESYGAYWRFAAAEVAAGTPSLRVHVEEGASAGEIALRLQPIDMKTPAGFDGWSTVWFPPGALAVVDEPPTQHNAAVLVAEALSKLLDEHGEALGKALRSVPIGVGAEWHPANDKLVVLALPWERFEGSQAVFLIRCAFQLEGGVDVQAELYTAGLGAKAPYPGNGESFEALVGMPQHRRIAGVCKSVDEVMDEVRTFHMHEILLEAERSTPLLSASHGC
jgi:hypothetical protein